MLIPFHELFRKYRIKPRGVLHVGASTGQEAAEYYKHGIKHTCWIEAIAEVYGKLTQHISIYPNAIAFNVCVSDVDGQEITFNIANNEGQSSSFLEFGTHATEHPTVKFIDKIQLITTRLDTLIDREGIEVAHYDMLNIDLQGAELLALKGLGDYLSGFRYLYLEVNIKELYKGCPLVEEIDEYVRGYGFERKETKWTNWGWGDAFYVKTY